MNLGAWFREFHLNRISLNAHIVGVEMSFEDTDKDAAWELYIEMLTRTVTQPLSAEAGGEEAALDSVYSLFPTTREILRRQGRNSIRFSMIAIPVLNQVVRPFTTKWHSESLAGAFDDADKRAEFRQELTALQEELRNYNRMLADIAGVEDLTDLESVQGD